MPEGFTYFDMQRRLDFVFNDPQKCKRRVQPVIDLRALNEMIIGDAYASPQQSEVVEMLAGCNFISVLDATSFFYQWRLHPDYRYMMTVVSHRGQKSFNVPIMGCVNSIAYVQRQIDALLRKLKAKAKAYLDDIITGSETDLQRTLSRPERAIYFTRAI